MKFKKIASLVLASVITLSALCFPVSAQTDYTYKLKPALSEKLEKMNDNDTVAVSVWFKDIDYNVVEAKAIKNIGNNISNDVLKIAKADESSAEMLSLYKSQQNKTIKQQKKESAEMQKLIEEERDISSKMQVENNKNIMNRLFEDGDYPTIIYSCKYAPNVDMYLTKSQIEDIIKSDYVEDIYYINLSKSTNRNNNEKNNVSSCIKDKETVDEAVKNNKEASSQYSMKALSVSGLTSTRDAYSLFGSGVNIGIYDNRFDVDESSYSSFLDKSRVNTNGIDKNLLINYGTMNGNIESCLIAGYTGSQTQNTSAYFCGAVPSASLYWTNKESYKEALEFLISSKCNVINLGTELLDYGIYNEYEDTAKWIDHITYNHKVHVVTSAGDFAEFGINASSMSYNAITVGSCNNNGVISDFSAYYNEDFMGESNINNLPYKPDLVAPGEEINTPAGSDTGTLYSSALVTGAVAQFCQLNATLRTSPTLMKALLLSGSKRTDEMIKNNVCSTVGPISIAFDRKYGCGMLYTNNMYIAFHDDGIYTKGTLTSSSQNVTFKTTMHTYNVNRQVRITAVWDKVSTVSGSNHSSGNATNYNNDIFKLTVCDPQGNYYNTYSNDTKALISFKALQTGEYTITLSRMNTSGKTINYAIACSRNVES